MYNNAIRYWNSKKEKIKQKYPVITVEDLNFREGKEIEMVEMPGVKPGKTIDEMRQIIASL